MPEPVNFAFLHGGGQGSWVWDETIAALEAAGDVRCLALDAPGCGKKRARDTSEVVFDDIAQELVNDIKVAGMSDVVLVGHSQAGTVLPLMAEFAPGLFSKLVFVSCTAPLPGKTTTEQMGEGLHGSNPDQVGWPVGQEASMDERYRAMFCNDMNDADTNAFMAKLGKDMWPLVSYMHNEWRYDHLRGVPVAFVKCMKDMSLPPDWQDRFAERLHADEVVEIDAGHQAMNTKSAELAAILLAQAGR